MYDKIIKNIKNVLRYWGTYFRENLLNMYRQAKWDDAADKVLAETLLSEI